MPPKTNITITKHKGRYHICKNGVLMWEMNPTEYARLKEALIERENKERMAEIGRKQLG